MTLPINSGTTGAPQSTLVRAERADGDWTSGPEAMDRDRVLPMVSELSGLSASAILAEAVGEEEEEGLLEVEGAQ